jgi:hypothetical protein
VGVAVTLIVSIELATDAVYVSMLLVNPCESVPVDKVKLESVATVEVALVTVTV